MASRDDALREAAVRAIGAWNVASLQNRLVELAGAADTPRGGSRRGDRGARPATAGPRGAGSSRAWPSAARRRRSRRWVLAALAGGRRQGDDAACRRLARPALARPVERGRDRAGARSGAARSARRLLASALDQARADLVRRSGQAVHPPGPRLGPRRARPDRRPGKGRPAQGGRSRNCRTRR